MSNSVNWSYTRILINSIGYLCEKDLELTPPILPDRANFCGRGVNPCHLVQSLHPTSQNSFIFGFYYPFSDIRHCVNLFCSILIRLEMRAIWNMLDFALNSGPKITKNIANFICINITPYNHAILTKLFTHTNWYVKG